MACKRCGQCCSKMHFVLGEIAQSDEAIDYARYISFHRCEPFRAEATAGRKEALGVNVPLSCVNLMHDQATGACSCAVYEDRPQVCRDYMCEFAKKSE